jgi:hypothetical protein
MYLTLRVANTNNGYLIIEIESNVENEILGSTGASYALHVSKKGSFLNQPFALVGIKRSTV